jgi:hypothetical protein
MAEPSNARGDLEAEWLPRCCQAWIVEQTRPRGRRERTERGQRDVPAQAHGGQRERRESLSVAAARPD